MTPIAPGEVIDDNRNPPAEWPVLRQGKRKPRTPIAQTGKVDGTGLIIACLYESEINASGRKTTIYPDSGDSLRQDSSGVWTFDTGGGHGDHVSTGCDRLGRIIGTTDQQGVAYDHSFDAAGRVTGGRSPHMSQWAAGNLGKHNRRASG